MASDQVAIALGVLAVTGPIITAGVTLWIQAKREKDARAAELVREKQQQQYDLQRDRLAKYYGFNVEEYRECRDACGALLAATQHFVTAAGARSTALEAGRRFPTPRSLGTLNAETDIFVESNERSADYADQALRLLRIDPDASNVVETYQSLPAGPLLKAPKDEEVKRRWNDAVVELQRVIFDYLQAKRAKLLPDGEA